MKSDLSDLRENYGKDELLKANLADHPVKQFQLWLDEAMKANLLEPNVMVLSTINSDGAPESRVVLLKEILDGDFVFYTNYTSDKAVQMQNHPFVAANFLWKPLERQVRITGTAEKVPQAVSQAYWDRRPRGSRIGAWASPQSDVISERSILDEKMTELQEKFKDVKDIPLPPDWGGYAITPATVEFWQGRPSRMHDRLRYRLEDEKWIVERLAP